MADQKFRGEPAVEDGLEGINGRVERARGVHPIHAAGSGESLVGTDEDLASTAARGDREAFVALYRRYVGRMYGYVAFKVGPFDADDAVSEIFLRALRTINRFENGRSFAAWIFGIARNVLRERARARGTDRPLEFAAQEPSGRGDPVGSVLTTERMALARSVVESLSGLQREVVELRYWAGLPFKEIAAITGRSEGAVRVMAYRTIRDVRKRLEREVK